MLRYRRRRERTLLTCKLAQVENTQALSIGCSALPWREGTGLEMIGGWAGGKNVGKGSVAGSDGASEP